jgi:hypothetical protein
MRGQQNIVKFLNALVKKIRKEGKAYANEVLTTPGKKRKRPENCNAVVDFDWHIIQNVMQNFYVNLKAVSICEKILPILKEKIYFNWSKVHFERGVEFQWKICSKRRVLIKRPDM